MLIIQYLYKKACSGQIHGGYVPKAQTSKVSKEKRKCSLSSKSSEEVYEYYDDTMMTRVYDDDNDRKDSIQYL